MKNVPDTVDDSDMTLPKAEGEMIPAAPLEGHVTVSSDLLNDHTHNALSPLHIGTQFLALQELKIVNEDKPIAVLHQLKLVPFLVLSMLPTKLMSHFVVRPKHLGAVLKMPPQELASVCRCKT
uniref:Uncharacterized protein n=1 Tax=Vitrella brassicaformis TaxID=1169539 RepID=A0A7S1KKG5_9ALVE|mmetsp:Transcript_9156/g.22452  ORF Transcript_9156/g.22452 Transcript_9156/m.22452 type:complete len:123 (+) Transcript_9156:109-477(+)